jgi:DNA processing protein
MNSPTDRAGNNEMLTEAILLLCGHFNANDTKNIKPLTPTEYSRLALWLHQHKYTPADLLMQKEALLEQWIDPRSDFKNPITCERLQGLLGRAASMGFALEKWQQQNVQVISRASSHYPKIIREAFTDTRPPLLYCIGNTDLLKNKAIGFVGSRKIVEEDKIATQGYVENAVYQGYMIVSGAAKGVDETAMIAALEVSGTAIGIVAESLLKIATNKHYRQAIIEGRLLLISTNNPDARFSPGIAMARNKYIYVLSKGVVVIKSGTDGGTWTGAVENLKKKWVPLLVRNIAEQGNQQLIQQGGLALSSGSVDFTAILQNGRMATQPQPVSTDFFSDDSGVSTEPKPEPEIGITEDIFSISNDATSQSSEETTDEKELAEKAPEPEPEPHPEKSEEFNKAFNHYGQIFQLFYQGVIETNTQHNEITADLLLKKYPELKKAQISEWLKQLEAEGLLLRPSRKLTYTLADKTSIQGLL